jgi:serine/threonine protein kinase
MSRTCSPPLRRAPSSSSLRSPGRSSYKGMRNHPPTHSRTHAPLTHVCLCPQKSRMDPLLPVEAPRAEHEGKFLRLRVHSHSLAHTHDLSPIHAHAQITEDDFDVHRIIGRGGFGEVFPCRKRDTGAVFAMKKLDKKRLKLKHQELSAVHERNVLSEMHSKFVTNLKYAFHDNDTLFLILDLMEGGDLSFHLKRKKVFNEWEVWCPMAVGHTHTHTLLTPHHTSGQVLCGRDLHGPRTHPLSPDGVPRSQARKHSPRRRRACENIRPWPCAGHLKGQAVL